MVSDYVFCRLLVSVVLIHVTADSQHPALGDRAGTGAPSVPYLESTFTGYEILTLDDATSGINASAEFQLIIHAFNRTFRIRETDDDRDSTPVFEPDAQVILHGMDGIARRVPAINFLQGYMVGQLVDDPGSTFYGWYDGKRVSGGRAVAAVDGVLELEYGDDLLFLESTAGFLADCAPFWHEEAFRGPPHLVVAYRPAQVHRASCAARNASGSDSCQCNRQSPSLSSPPIVAGVPDVSQLEIGNSQARRIKRSSPVPSRPPVQTCVLKVVVDPSFVRRVGASSYNRSVAEIVTHVHFANRVLARTVFAPDVPVLQLSLGEIEMMPQTVSESSASSFWHPGGTADDDFITVGADAYLASTVARMHQMAGNFCIGLLLTYRSFNDGSYGASHRAKVGIGSDAHFPKKPGPSGEGGFCAKPIVTEKVRGVGHGRRLTYQRSRDLYYSNTAVVSFGGVAITGNDDQPVGFKAPRATTLLRFLHQLGHLLGGRHEGEDPELRDLEEELGCIRPNTNDFGPADMPFLMSPDTDPGALATNWSYSLCSRLAMASALRGRLASGCPRLETKRGGGIGVGGQVRFKVSARSYSPRVHETHVFTRHAHQTTTATSTTTA